MIKGLPFEATLPETIIIRAETKKAFSDLRAQTSDIPEMSLDEINSEISETRAKRKEKS